VAGEKAAGSMPGLFEVDEVLGGGEKSNKRFLVLMDNSIYLSY